MYPDGRWWGAPVRRRFEYFDGYEIHFREAGSPERPPVLCLHPSPVSSAALVALVSELGSSFHVLAPDTVGNGDSVGPMPERPDIAYFAEVCSKFLAARGIDRCMVYGSHTGAAIAMELARQGRVRVERAILDGVGLYPQQFQEKLLQSYTPRFEPDTHGLYALKLWSMLRDMYLFWPWFETGASNRRAIDLPAPEIMHFRFVETLKAASTFRKSYEAAFRYDKETALRQLDIPVLVTTPKGDVLSQSDQKVLAALREGIHRQNWGFADKESARRSSVLFSEFFSAGPDFTNDHLQRGERPCVDEISSSVRPPRQGD